MMYSHKHNQAGFSLVETLVAITILLIVITGPLTLVSNSARSTDFANDQVMANFLAQEGLELVQAQRDDFLIPAFFGSSGAWSAFTSTSQTLGACLDPSGCGLDQATNSAGSLNVVSCSDIVDCRLYFNGAENQRSAYTHGANDNPSRYTRKITMIETTPGQVQVLSTVTWRSDGQRAEQSVEAVTYLFDVYGR